MTTEEGLIEVMDYFPDPIVERLKDAESQMEALTLRIETLERLEGKG